MEKPLRPDDVAARAGSHLDAEQDVLTFVIGSGLRELAGEKDPPGKRYVRSGRTAPRYRLLSVGNGTWAALVEDEREGISVPGELYLMSGACWRATLADEPPGITPGEVELESGEVATAGFGDEAFLMAGGAEDITRFGGFLEYLRAVRPR